MKRSILLTAIALIISAAVTAQSNTQTQSQTQTQTQTQPQTQNQVLDQIQLRTRSQLRERICTNDGTGLQTRSQFRTCQERPDCQQEMFRTQCRTTAPGTYCDAAIRNRIRMLVRTCAGRR